MIDYLPYIGILAVLIAGLIAGMIIMVYGLRLGFKLSYEIRNHTEKEGGGIFPEPRPAEFALQDGDEGDGDVAEGVLE